MRKIQRVIFLILGIHSLAMAPLASAEGSNEPDPGVICSGFRSGVEGGEPGCYEEEPYIPTDCELQMWDIWAAADLAVNSLLSEPICAELVASWGGLSDEPVIGIADQFGPVSESVSGNREAKVKVITKKRLRKLNRAASRCRAKN